MLTQPLRQTAEYQSLLAAVAGPVPAAAALFGLPPTARAQVLAALCEDTGHPFFYRAASRGLSRAGFHLPLCRGAKP